MVLARVSQRWPESNLQLPSPNSSFLFSRNFLLVIILILYLFSSAENWCLICPARLCGGSLIDPRCATLATSRSASSALCHTHSCPLSLPSALCRDAARVQLQDRVLEEIPVSRAGAAQAAR